MTHLSDAKDYLAGLLGKERGEAINSSHVHDENEDEDHGDVACSEEQDESDDDNDCDVSVLPKPGEVSSSDTEDYGPYWNNSSESMGAFHLSERALFTQQPSCLERLKLLCLTCLASLPNFSLRGRGW